MLTMAPLPKKGTLTFCKSIEEAVKALNGFRKACPSGWS